MTSVFPEIVVGISKRTVTPAIIVVARPMGRHDPPVVGSPFKRAGLCATP